MKARVLLCLVGCFFVTTTSRSQLEKHIDSLLQDYQDQPSVSVGVFKHGKKVYHKSFGFSNMDYDLKASNQTVYDIASASKQFTAACIILLENDGDLSLNDPIQKYLPEFPEYEEGTITIKHLLHHTSGLRGYLALIHAKGASWDDRYNNDYVLNLLENQQEINFKPGSRYSYSNSGYVLLSLIVERISGKTLGQFAKEHIFKPLEMNDTFIYEDADAIVKNRAIGYVDEGNGFRREHFFNSTVTGDDGVYSTIDDLFKWSENFKSSKIGSATFIDKMLATEPLNDGSPQTYAGGLILGDYLPGLYSIGHSGEWGGFRSLFFKFPEQDATFIILSNNGNLNPWAILRPMVDVVLEDEIANIEAPSVETESRPSTERANFKMSQKSLKDYVGHYYNFLDGYSREIKMERDTLIYLRPDGRATKLIPTGKSNFVFMGATNVSVRFKNEKAPSLSIVLNIPGQSPIALSKYRPKQYTDTELEKFEGIYFSEELDVKYHLKVNGNSLAINVNGDILETVSSVMENVFDAPHFGYLKFNENADGTIDSFTINDELRRNILFLKLVNDETQKLN